MCFRRGRQRFLEQPIGVQPAAAGHHLGRQQHELLQLALGLLRADGDRLEIDIDVQAVQFRQRRLAARRRSRLHGGGAEIRGPVGPVPLAQERLNVFWLPGGDMALADFALARIGIRQRRNIDRRGGRGTEHIGEKMARNHVDALDRHGRALLKARLLAGDG